MDGDDRVVGVSVSYDGAELRRLRQPFIDAVKEAFGRDFSAMPEETSAGELYLDSLAVEPAWQGQGIAKALLKATAERAARIGCGPVGLLVDSNNPRAERLYATYEGSYIVRGGKKLTDLKAIMPELRRIEREAGALAERHKGISSMEPEEIFKMMENANKQDDNGPTI